MNNLEDEIPPYVYVTNPKRRIKHNWNSDVIKLIKYLIIGR